MLSPEKGSEIPTSKRSRTKLAPTDVVMDVSLLYSSRLCSQIVWYLQSPPAAEHLVLSYPPRPLLKPSFHQLYGRRADLLTRAAGFPALPVSVQLGSGKMCPDSSWGNSLKTSLSGPKGMNEWMNEWIPERHQGTCWAGRKSWQRHGYITRASLHTSQSQPTRQELGDKN